VGQLWAKPSGGVNVTGDRNHVVVSFGAALG
jgi:hypothetical protein